MLKLLTQNTFLDLRKRLTLLYILNASDIVFTFGLLKTGMFEEINSLMVGIVQDPLLSIAIKLITPALLIIYILLKLEDLPDINLKLCNCFVNTVLIIYIIINVMHLTYFGLFLYTL
ncbi:MAG: DUF5658 family protein [Niameybacter sp.]|uniref:DUF5658 family protein n=1 Tax=Niameybacter sp. TaxID=2033640 RepID=UPI002FC836A5